MQLGKLLLVALVASFILAPFVFAAKQPMKPLFARNQNAFGNRVLSKIRSETVPKLAAKMAAIKAGAVSTRNDVTACSAVTTCSECITSTYQDNGATKTCVWTVAQGMTPDQRFGSFGLCAPGTAADGPDEPAADATYMLFGINIFSAEGLFDYAYWSTERTCDQLFTVSQIDSFVFDGIGFATRAATTIQSTYGSTVSAEEFESVNQLPPEESFEKFNELVISFFKGITLYNLSVFMEGGATADERAGFSMFYFGLDMSEFMKAIFSQAEAEPPASGDGQENAQSDNINLGQKAVMFYTILDSVRAYTAAAGTALTGETTTLKEISVTQLTVSESAVDTTSNPGVSVHNYHMAGALGASGMSFDMSCYLGTEAFTLHGRTVNPTTFECDFILTNMTATVFDASTNNYMVGLATVLVSLDTNLDEVNKDTATDSLTISVGNADLVVLGTANADSFSGTSMTVMVSQQPECTGFAWLTTEFLTALQNEFEGTTPSTYCVFFSFDTQNPTNIYWDPAGAVDEEKANASINSKLETTSSASAFAPLVAVIVAAIAVVFAL